jgi:CheY-like chemotaxis protein
MAHKLLLADDSVTIQRVIELTFADEDIQVTAVGDGKKAIASIQSDRPDIVLADVGMPERDGYEVASFIKTNSELAHIPVLLLTGAFEPIDEARARAVGCDGVLVKPFEPQMVINRVKDLLAGRRPGLATTPSTPAARQPAAAANAEAIRVPASAGGPGGSLEDYFDRLDAAFASMEGPSPPPAPETSQALPPVPAPPAPHPDPPRQPWQMPSSGGSPVPEGIAQWDPDLTGDPRKPAPIDPPPIELDPARGFTPIVASHAPAPAPYVAPPPPAPPVARAAPHVATPAPVPVEASQPAPEPVAAPPVADAPVLPLPTLAEAFAALLSAEQGRSLSAPAIAPPSDQFVEDIVQRVIVRMGDRAVRETVTDIAERLVREEIARIKSA